MGSHCPTLTSQVFFSDSPPAQPAFSVTDNNETVITSTEELIETATTPEVETEEAGVPERHYASSNSYDPSGNEELDPIRLRLNSRPLDEKWATTIRSAAGKKHFPLELQFETVNPEKQVYYTLGDLAATAQHEKATQYIYADRVSHVLFGPHGIAKGSKLSNDIQLCWFRKLDGELDSMPVITSGRHRVTAIILLLQHLGIPWERQKIMVSTKVVSSESEFAQLIFDNNDSRKMKQAEKRNHKLGALGVNTASEEAFYNDPLNSVRHAANNVCPQAFAAASRFCAADKPIEFQDRLYMYAAGAFNKLVGVSKENREFMRSLVQGTGPDHNDLEALKVAAEYVADNLLSAIALGREKFPLAYECHSAPKGLAILLASHLGVTVPDFTEAK